MPGELAAQSGNQEGERVHRQGDGSDSEGGADASAGELFAGIGKFGLTERRRLAEVEQAVAATREIVAELLARL